MGTRIKTLICLFLVSLVSLPLLISGESCESESDRSNMAANYGATALKYKIGAILSILIAGFLGVSLPILGSRNPYFNPSSNPFILIKSFAAGVILATGFVHILPDAFESLGSPCLGDEPPWGDFPMTGLVAMVSAIGTMLIDAFATAYFERSHADKEGLAVSDKEIGGHDGRVHVHTHATHGHAHGSDIVSEADLRHKIVSQVLELGILVHSVIIGLSLGASQSLKTIKPLFAALTFHQLFEGLGLGGCISQAKFGSRTTIAMVIFFSLTTPIGIGIGIGVSETYNENSPTALIVGGVLNAAASGILIYMALVDLLAADFMDAKIRTNLKMQFGCSLSLLLGVGLMSLLAIWA